LYDEFHEAWPGGKLESWCHNYRAGCFAGATAHFLLDGSTEQLAQVRLRIESATQAHSVKTDLHVIQSITTPRRSSRMAPAPSHVALLEQFPCPCPIKLQDALDNLSSRDPALRRRAATVQSGDLHKLNNGRRGLNLYLGSCLGIVCVFCCVVQLFGPYWAVNSSAPDDCKRVPQYYDALTQLWQNRYAQQKSSVHSLLQVPTHVRAETASWGEDMEPFDSNMVDYLIWTSIKLHLPARPKILDAGSGLGGTLFYLQRRIGEGSFEGLTLSQLQAEEARARIPSPRAADFHFRVADFTDPLPPGQYDAIICVESLFHAHDLRRVIINLKVGSAQELGKGVHIPAIRVRISRNTGTPTKEHGSAFKGDG
jgi:hypothetical protein